MHAYNWTEDDSELIDFENSSFNEDTIDINDSCKIYRIGDDIKLEYTNEDNNNSSGGLKLSEFEDSIKMGEIRYRKNKYFFVPNLQEELEDLNGEKAFSWLVFKGEKYPITKNKYKIKEGDIFKLARIFFIVRGIHIKQKKSGKKDGDNLISYHSQNNQSLNVNEDYKYANILKDNTDSDNDSSNTDFYEENESDEEDKDKDLKAPKIKQRKNSKNRYKKKIKKNDKDKVNEIKSVKTVNVKNKNANVLLKPKANDNHLITDESKKSEKQKICRICYMNESDDSNPLIRPCKCSGSMKYIHLKCLLHWLKTKIEIDKSEYIENEYFHIYSPENVECELCKEHFPHYLKHNNKLLNLTELEQDTDSDSKINTKNEGDIVNDLDNNYIVLDSMSPDKEIIPYRYIVKFSKNKILKIGRGLEMNLILNDLSISRNHCQLELDDNGDILLKDNNSKFGTLVLVQSKAIEILKGQILTIQTGRTYFNISYKTNFSLFSCCKAEEVDLSKTYEKINSKSVKIDKNCVILTESDSEEEEKLDTKIMKMKSEEGKKNDNEYENNIKNINNKKIKLMKIAKKKEKAETNIQSQKENNENNNMIDNSNKSDIEPKEIKTNKKLNQSSDNKDDENKNDENNKDIDNKEGDKDEEKEINVE